MNAVMISLIKLDCEQHNLTALFGYRQLIVPYFVSMISVFFTAFKFCVGGERNTRSISFKPINMSKFQ